MQWIKHVGLFDVQFIIRVQLKVYSKHAKRNITIIVLQYSLSGRHHTKTVMFVSERPYCIYKQSTDKMYIKKNQWSINLQIAKEKLWTLCSAVLLDCHPFTYDVSRQYLEVMEICSRQNCCGLTDRRMSVGRLFPSARSAIRQGGKNNT